MLAALEYGHMALELHLQYKETVEQYVPRIRKVEAETKDVQPKGIAVKRGGMVCK